MANQVVAYSSLGEKAADDFSQWLWGHFYKFIGVGMAISVLPFSLGALIAPEGHNRLQKGMDATVVTHVFLWHSAGQAASVIVPPIQNWLDNGDETIKNS